MTVSSLTIALAIAISAPASAHHSIAGMYDSSQNTTLEGVVAQFHFVNPHPFVLVTVQRNGGMEQWQMEMDNRRELSEIGFTDTTLKPGDRVVVHGSPARREVRKLYIWRLDRPADGWAYEQVGTRPRVRFPSAK
jgi:hypothetical protein